MKHWIKKANEIEAMVQSGHLKELCEKQKQLLSCLLSPDYEESTLNPCRAFTTWGELGPIYSAFQSEVAGMCEDACLKKTELRRKKEELALKVEEFFKNSEGLKEAETVWKKYLIASAEAEALDFVRGMVNTGADNCYEQILFKANGTSLGWLGLYGLPITEIEQSMVKFWFSIPEEELNKMGHLIADAFLHGFISQSRDRRGRTRVRFYYQVGQEALAKQVVLALKEKGLQAVVTKPKTLYALNQYQADHQYDKWFLLDEELYETLWNAHKTVMYCWEEELKDTCGMIGIDQFGSETFIVTPCERANILSEEAKRLYKKLSSKKAQIESDWIKPSEISFCKIAFPNMLVGQRFEEIFQDFFTMNSIASEPYELLQQQLIDVLDTCEYVEIKGSDGNETDLRVQMWPIKNPKQETKFLNCGGDLNIPYGEIFTTPKLIGSNGILHVKEICLRGVFYHDLRLVFRDGMLREYDCVEGIDYIRENLLYPEESLPIGEFAIGTNTSAYAIAKKYNLGSRLPILIYEKMGPHVAIGDPCFARAEDAPIYNMYDKKEMTCKENEVTKARIEKSDVYFGKHVDITLPYDEVEYLRGVRKDGTNVFLIREGCFVLEGMEGLNEGLK